MSKMFDSLRRAEAERRRKAALARAPEETPDAPGGPPTLTKPYHGPATAAPSHNGTGELPEDFVRELGILRNSIDTALKDVARRVLVFTSAAREEGTTTLAWSYSRLLALAGDQRVLLVEMNARHPSLFWRLRMTAPEGMSHYLVEERPLASLVQRASRSKIDCIHVGEKNPSLIQLHLGDRYPQFLEEARAAYDTVVIDAPPVVVAPETPPMTRGADGVVMVVHCGYTRREIVRRSIEMIRQFDGNVLGVVLNRKRYYIPDFIYRHV